MPSQSVWSKYTKLFRGNGEGAVGVYGPPETWALVIEVTDLTLPTMTNELIDVSNFDSVGPFRERLATFLDAGDSRATVNYIAGDPTQLLLINDQVSQTLRKFKTEFRNAAGVLGATMFWSAYVSFAITASIRAQRQATLTMNVTGQVIIS